MAKTIKFNLILDNHPVRNIEELQEHFSIEDMLKYFENGLLLRWLKVRGYEKEYMSVENIDKSLDSKDIIISLMKIFKMSDIDTDDIEKEVSILSYLDKENELNKIYKENAFAKNQIIKDYHTGYNALIVHMEENKENMAVLKADVFQMEKEYSQLFSLNYYELYFRLLNSAPKAIFVMLTKDIFREYWLDKQLNSKDLSIKRSIESILSDKRVEEILGDDLKVVKRNTEAMWDPIERPTVKVMIISIARGTFIKNAGNFSEKLSSEDVNEKLLRLNGLEYQSNSDVHKLLYMEV